MSEPEPDQDRDRAELLDLHARVRRAHFDNDADLLVAQDADEWINVRDGQVFHRRREEERARFAEYLEGATYHEWDDIEPPVVRVSGDGGTAWMIVHVRVHRTKGGEEQRFRYAGLETFEKRAGRWTKVVEVGTFARG